MDEQRVLVERVGAVAVITPTRPEAFYALTLRDWEQLLDALIECGEDREVRAVVLTGAGQTYCAGADLREMEACASASRLAPLRLCLPPPRWPESAQKQESILSGTLALRGARRLRLAPLRPFCCESW